MSEKQIDVKLSGQSSFMLQLSVIKIGHVEVTDLSTKLVNSSKNNEVCADDPWRLANRSRRAEN